MGIYSMSYMSNLSMTWIKQSSPEKQLFKAWVQENKEICGIKNHHLHFGRDLFLQKTSPRTATLCFGFICIQIYIILH